MTGTARCDSLDAHDVALGLYGGSPAYADRLLAFCAEHGWQLHPNTHRRLCRQLLVNPRHRCSSEACYRDRLLHEFVEGDWNIDHPVLLRRGPVNRPSQWAVLSQPYDDSNPGERAVILGPGPYGSGTFALLYVGTEVTPGA